MREHFKMLRQLSAHGPRGGSPVAPSYFSFCSSASAKKDDIDDENYLQMNSRKYRKLP